jgi:hypothetical protein
MNAYFARNDRHFTPRKGFETALWATLQDVRSVDEAVAALLASGDYQRVAPQAAALRPRKPVAFLVKEWAGKGYLATCPGTPTGWAVIEGGPEVVDTPAFVEGGAPGEVVDAAA